jgi:Icc-related predicted phosphoesterase
MRLVVLSDTHSQHDEIDVPEGDVLIHAGDMSSGGTLDELRQFNDWLADLPHRRKLFVPGNHDFCFEGQTRDRALDVLTEATCLIDQETTIDDYTIWGAPWQPKFFDWAFNKRRGRELREKWEQIPESTDLLITHGPPRGIGDEVSHGERVGCRELYERITVVQPEYHVFGHIHEGYGQYVDNGVTFVNASVCDVRRSPRNRPIVIES